MNIYDYIKCYPNHHLIKDEIIPALESLTEHDCTLHAYKTIQSVIRGLKTFVKEGTK